MFDPIIQYKYVNLLGNSLEGFKEIRQNLYNFRCPICGDSEHKATKKRGYLFQKNGEFIFYCHNCGNSMNLSNFLKEVDSSLYSEYRKDLLLQNKIKFSKKEEEIKVPKFEIKSKSLISISDLDKSHKAYQYLVSRKVPFEKFSFIKWTEDFPQLVHNTIGSKYDNSYLPKEGIIFELKELNGKTTGYQIRSIDINCKKEYRFVICSINDDHGYFYQNIDYTKNIFIVEGCTDSLFLPNSIAILSSTLWKLHLSDNCIYFNDNEPRNYAVCKQIEKCISKGYKVVLLPDEYENMDVNDLVKSGIDYKDIEKLFLKYTYSGLSAKIQFAKWKK